MIQSSHWFGLLLRRQIWLDGLRSPASLALSRKQIGLAMLALTAHPPNWIQANFATPRRTKPVSLIDPRSVWENIIIIQHYDTSAWLIESSSLDVS